MVVQSLKGIFAIFRKQTCRQIEGRKDYKEPECKISPQQQCDHQIRDWLQVFVYVRVQRLTVQGFFIIRQVFTPPKAKFWMAAMRISDSTSSWA